MSTLWRHDYCPSSINGETGHRKRSHSLHCWRWYPTKETGRAWTTPVRAIAALIGSSNQATLNKVLGSKRSLWWHSSKKVAFFLSATVIYPWKLILVQIVSFQRLLEYSLLSRTGSLYDWVPSQFSKQSSDEGTLNLMGWLFLWFRTLDVSTSFQIQ